MRQACYILAVIASATVAAAQPTLFRPADAPRPREGWRLLDGVWIRPADAPRPREGWRLLDGVWIRPAGQFEFSQLVAVSINEGRLAINIAADETWKPKLINARRIIAEAASDRSLWWMMLTQTNLLAPAGQRGTSLVLLPTFDASADKDALLRVAGVTIAPAGTILRGAGQADGRFVQVEYHSARDGRSPRLTVVTSAGRGFDFSGEDFFDLLKKDAPVVRRFLGPLLKELSGDDLLRPRAADVYRAFVEIEPTPEEVAQFEAVVKSLNSTDRDIRDAASVQLEKLGPPAALAAVRTNFDRLTPEQAMRLSLFIDSQSLGETDTARVRSDIEFLRSLEAFPDRRVRDLARELLTQFTN